VPVVPAPNLALLRTKQHVTDLSLNVYVPPTIWSAQVNGAQANGSTSIAVDNVVNVRTPAKNMQVFFGTTPGASDLGEARWRSYAAPTLNVSIHNSDLGDDVYITVKEVIQPQSIHVGIVYGVGFGLDHLFEDNDIPYTDDNTNYPPLARCGTHCVIYLDPNTLLATGKFYSRSTGIAGATISSVLWSWRGGTVTAGSTVTAGTSGAPNQVTWNAPGDYYCSLTVTDNHGKTHTRFFVVMVRNPNSFLDTISYRKLEISTLEGDEAGVWSGTITVRSIAAISEFPKNALCVLSAVDRYGATQQSIGNELYRENIVMVGYIKSGSVKQDWIKGTVTFSLWNIAGVLSTLGELAGDLETPNPPNAVDPWHLLNGMTYNLAVHHLLVWHSTVSQLADVYLNLTNFTAEFVTLPEGAMSEQLTPICNSVSGRWGGTALGHLYFEPHPQLQPVSTRSTSYILAQNLTDLRDEVDFGDEPQNKIVSRIDFWGEDAAGTPFGSWAPPTPWSSGSPLTLNGIRIVDQANCNVLAGLYEAYKNLGFKQVILPWRGNYRIFDVFPAEPISVTAPPNKRNIAWAGMRFWINHVTYDFSKIGSGVLLVSTTVEMDIKGSLAIGQPEPPPGTVPPYPTVIPPPGTLPPVIWPGPTPFPPPPPNPPPNPTTVPGRGNLLYVSTHKGLACCKGAYGTTGLNGAPIWTNLSAQQITATVGTITQAGFTITGSGTQFLSQVAVGDRIIAVGIDATVTVIGGDTSLTVDVSATVGVGATFTLYHPNPVLAANVLSLVIRKFVVDPFSLSGDHFTAAWAMTDGGLYRITGLPNTPVWTLQLNLATAYALAGSPGIAGTQQLTYSLSANAMIPGFIATQLCVSNDYFSPRPFVYGADVWTIYSLDYGATWHCDSAKYLHFGGVIGSGNVSPWLYIAPSTHLGGVYYVGGNAPSGDQASGYYAAPYPSIARVPGNRGGAFPDFSAGMSIDVTPVFDIYRYFLIPYSDKSGVIYANDNRIYVFNGTPHSPGVAEIRRFDQAFNPIYSNGYTPPTGINIGDAGMGNINHLLTNMFNEDYGVGIAQLQIWFTKDLTASPPTWNGWTPPAVGARALNPINLFCVPIDKNLVYFTGAPVGGGFGLPCFTTDFGVAVFNDISKQGLPDSFDQVMGLSSTSQMDDSEIFIDFNYTDGSPVVPPNPLGSQGIDISHYQGAMDWAKAKANGVTFAFIKASEGTGVTDAQFAANWAGAKAQGISRGAYHYFINNLNPTTQANHFLSVLGSDHGELKMALDCEDTGSAVSAANIQTFLTVVEAALGYKPIIYTGSWWWNNTRFGGAQAWAKNHELWLAGSSIPTDWSDWKYNQYSTHGVGANYGATPGDIDLDKTK